jgi:hypothetical protein
MTRAACSLAASWARRLVRIVLSGIKLFPADRARNRLATYCHPRAGTFLLKFPLGQRPSSQDWEMCPSTSPLDLSSQ